MKNILWGTHDPERLPASREGVERFRVPQRGTQSKSLTALLSFLGLLCSPLIFLSLSLTFLETYHPYGQTTSPSTGWHMLGGGFREMMLFAALILPIFPYLPCLLLFPVKSTWKDALLEMGFWLGCLSNIVGLAVAFTLTFGYGGDNVTYTTQAAAFIPFVAFFLSFLCSFLLLSPFLRHRKERRLRFREGVEEEALARTLSVARKQYQQGEAIAFGNVQVNQYGIVDLDNAVTWEQLEDIRLEDEVLSLKYESTWHGWYGTPSLKIHLPRYAYPPNMPVLVALVQEILAKKLEPGD